MHSGRCASCGKAFVPRPQVRQQRFCSAAACQRERRRRWQAERLQHDLDYRANQLAAQRAWRERHPEYWRVYRDRHPKYVERNRQQQRVRDGARRTQADLAKMNASLPDCALPSGTYRLAPVGPSDLAKMDAWTVEITVLSTA
jgi:hypothetical protein